MTARVGRVVMQIAARFGNGHADSCGEAMRLSRRRSKNVFPDGCAEGDHRRAGAGRSESGWLGPHREGRRAAADGRLDRFVRTFATAT